MHSFHNGISRQYVRKDVSAASLRTSDAEPNVIIRQFTLQKGKFSSELEDKNAPVVAVSSQVVNGEGKKISEIKEILPSNGFNQRTITVKKPESSQSTVESAKMQEVTESNVGQVRTTANPQSSKQVPVMLPKNSRLGMVGGKLVILQPLQGKSQVVQDLGQQFVFNPPNTTVFKKMKLSSSEDVHQSNSDGKQSTLGAAAKPSNKVSENKTNSGKESSAKTCQLRLETASKNPKGCIILPMSHVNNSDIVKLSTSPQNEVQVIKTTSNQVMVKKSAEGETGTCAEPALTSSAPKKPVIFKPLQPIMKLSDVPGNSPTGGKTFVYATNNNVAEKTNGKIKYVTLPAHMLPKLLPGTKVFTASVPQKPKAGNNQVVASVPKPVPETPTVKAAVPPVQQHSASKNPPATPNQTATNAIELKVDVDQKGDVVGVTPTRPLPKEQVDAEKAKVAVPGSWALLQKRCNQAMELKKKVLQKERCQIRVRKIPQRIVSEVDRGTQTSFFSLVEPGRLVEIQLENQIHREGESTREGKSLDEGNSSEAAGKSTDDDIEPPEAKKSKPGKQTTVYDVLVQHNIQTLSENPPKRRKLLRIRRPVSPLVHPSCLAPVDSNPDLSSLLDSPDSPNSSKLRGPELRRQLLEDFTHCIKRDNSGNIPLHIAVLYEQLPLVKRHCALLVARKASLDVHNDDTETPLHMAVMLRNEEIVQILLSFGASVSVANGTGNTALHLAILEGNEKILNALLSYSKGELPLDEFNDEGLAPLHLCAQANKLEEARALLNIGAEIDLRDAKSGRTPLFHAVERNAVSLVRLFLNVGANANLPNFSGHTPLLAANEFCDIPTPLANDALFMTPKLRPLNAEDRPMVAALVGLSIDAESQVESQKSKSESKIDQR